MKFQTNLKKAIYHKSDNFDETAKTNRFIVWVPDNDNPEHKLIEDIFECDVSDINKIKKQIKNSVSKLQRFYVTQESVNYD